MKKILSTFLALAIILSFTTSAYAYNDSEQQEDSKNPKTITLSPNGHGEYKKADRNNANIMTADTITATATEDAEIYHIKDGKYVTVTANDTYFLVDRVDIVIDDFSKNTLAFQKYQMPKDVIAEIEKTIAEQKKLGNKDLEIAVFAPSLSENETNPTLDPCSDLFNIAQHTADMALFGDTEIKPLTDGPWEEQPPRYYYYGNYYLMDYIVKYWHCSTGMVEKTGSGTKDVASAFINFTITAGGEIFECAAFPVYGFFTSALSVYQAIHGPVVYGGQGDHMNTNVVYDKLEKSTRVYYNGGWYVGCFSNKVWVERHDTYQFYGATGAGEFNQYPIGQTYYTESFEGEGAAAKAVMYFSYMRWEDQPTDVKIYSTHCLL